MDVSDYTWMCRSAEYTMRKDICKALLQLCVYLWLPVGRANCPYKECFCSPGGEILCSSINLQSIPQLNSSNTRSAWDLTIDGNNISEIPSGSLPSNLTDLDMDGNPVTTVDESAFDVFFHSSFQQIPKRIWASKCPY
ncbi:unnamed protein product [Candidula unifasciata]|uniref:Uncharacterized protein n=1 Tax=Candidula unifasciata TaxID=100452 RepID=A0A8S3ZCC8_9EUPU|nr:unnamed protein product [Candidula unifasciata]